MLNYFSSPTRWGGLLVMLLLASACGKSDENTYQPKVSTVSSKPVPAMLQYQIAAVPEGSQVRVAEAYGPLVDYLNAHLESAKLTLVAPRNHAELETGLSGRAYDFALGNALQVIKANDYNYHVIIKKGDDAQFYGIILVRRDSGIARVNDLKGKKVSYPSPTGVAATILPKQFFMQSGLDVNRDIESLYVGSHDQSIMHVYSGKTAAGTAREFSWKAFQKTHPKEAAELEVKWKTEPLIDQAIVARNDVPKELTERIGKLLLGLHETAEGRTVLSNMSCSKFEAASDATYDDARKFFSENSMLLETVGSSPKIKSEHKISQNKEKMP
jgi:phosphonate transport system substrate-binding protein